MKSVGNIKNKKSKGFTLVELITVVGIISLLVVYITFKMGSSNEDAKVGMTTTFLLGNVPAAISGFRARHMASCVDWTGSANLHQDLVASGLPPLTPWDEQWDAAYDHGNRRVIVYIPFTGSENAVRAATDVYTNLWGSPQVDSFLFVTGIPTDLTSVTWSGFADNVDDPTATLTVPTPTNVLAVAYDCV